MSVDPKPPSLEQATEDVMAVLKGSTEVITPRQWIDDPEVVAYLDVLQERGLVESISDDNDDIGYGVNTEGMKVLSYLAAVVALQTTGAADRTERKLHQTAIALRNAVSDFIEDLAGGTK